jgi:hypothetical protein
MINHNGAEVRIATKVRYGFVLEDDVWHPSCVLRHCRIFQALPEYLDYSRESLSELGRPVHCSTVMNNEVHEDTTSPALAEK